MKVYFVADAHLGARFSNNREYEIGRFAEWLNFAAQDADAIYMLGDIFDFWFEFARSVPQGYDVVLSALRRITSEGVAVHFVPGNHDQWTYGYLERECGIAVHPTKDIVEIAGKRFFLAHGHGLGEKRLGARIVNRIFENKVCRFMFRYLVPPRVGLAFGYRWSARNRFRHDRESQRDSENRHIDYYESHSSDSDAFQVRWAKNYAVIHPDTDYIVMGHLHREINMLLPPATQLVILDAFYSSRAYSVFDGDTITIDNF